MIVYRGKSICGRVKFKEPREFKRRHCTVYEDDPLVNFLYVVDKLGEISNNCNLCIVAYIWVITVECKSNEVDEENR